MINAKVRFQNKQFVVTFAVAVIAFIYQMLGMFGVVPAVSQDALIQMVALVANILMGLGILVDPTTRGFADSERAKSYKYLA